MEIYVFTERIYPRVSSKKGGSSVWVRIVQSFDLAILSILRERKFILFLAEVTQGRKERQFFTAYLIAYKRCVTCEETFHGFCLRGFYGVSSSEKPRNLSSSSLKLEPVLQGEPSPRYSHSHIGQGYWMTWATVVTVSQITAYRTEVTSCFKSIPHIPGH